MPPTLTQEKSKSVSRVMKHASGDKRFKILEVQMKRHQYKADALIEILHKAQELFGFLDTDLLFFVAYSLKDAGR
jgi:bidirectional [NiFe] hydrogenase diaphorase subunit